MFRKLIRLAGWFLAGAAAGYALRDAEEARLTEGMDSGETPLGRDDYFGSGTGPQGTREAAG